MRLVVGGLVADQDLDYRYLLSQWMIARRLAKLAAGLV